jgi:cytochrome c553
MSRRVATAVSMAAAIALAIGTAAKLAEAQAPPPRALLCAACHGSDGNSTQAGSPSLAAQPRLFLENQLVIIRDGLRDIPAMKGMLDGVDDAELVQLARHYASQPAKPTRIAVEVERAKRGAALAQRALCGTCHLPDYSGRDQIPRLARQREDYLLSSMRQFRTGVTPGRDTMMSAALHGLADADLVDLAHYFATLD